MQHGMGALPPESGGWPPTADTPHTGSPVLDGRIAVGELVTVYGTVALTYHPLRHFEEIAM
ncbi:MAG TPA: hypothetical protein VIU94_25805, partial [Streptomyces sp.]